MKPRKKKQPPKTALNATDAADTMTGVADAALDAYLVADAVQGLVELAKVAPGVVSGALDVAGDVIGGAAEIAGDVLGDL